MYTARRKQKQKSLCWASSVGCQAHLLLSAGACSTAPAAHTCSYRSISPVRRAPSGSKPAGCRCSCRSMGHTDGRTDGRTPNRCTDPAPHTMRTASISKTKHVDAEKYSYVIGADANIQRFVEKRLVELEVLKQTATDRHASKRRLQNHRNESVPKIIVNDTVNFFSLTAISILAISNHKSFRVLFDKIASVYFI